MREKHLNKYFVRSAMFAVLLLVLGGGGSLFLCFEPDGCIELTQGACDGTQPSHADAVNSFISFVSHADGLGTARILPVTVKNNRDNSCTDVSLALEWVAPNKTLPHSALLTKGLLQLKISAYLSRVIFTNEQNATPPENAPFFSLRSAAAPSRTDILRL